MNFPKKWFPRHLAPRIREALADTPVVLIHGPRQSGKTSLARKVCEPRGYRYISFDDEALVEGAKKDPIGFVEGLPPKAILDEVQRVPEIFTALKLAVDEYRKPGRFLLTGSANVLFLPRLADSLAGRMEILSCIPWPSVRSKVENQASWTTSFRADSGPAWGSGWDPGCSSGSWKGVTRPH